MFRQQLSIRRCPTTSSSKWTASCLPQVTPRSSLLAAGSNNFIAPEQNQIQGSNNTNSNNEGSSSTIINPFKGVQVEKSKRQLIEEIATTESVSFYSFTQQLPPPNVSVDSIQDVTALLHSMNISQHILDRNLRFQNMPNKLATRSNNDDDKNHNDDEDKKTVAEESNKSSDGSSVVEKHCSSQELIGSLLPFSSFKGLVSFCNQSDAASRDILLQCGAIGVLRDFIFRANKFFNSQNNNNNNNNNRDDSNNNSNNRKHNKNKNRNNNNNNENKKFAFLRQEVVQVKNWMHQLVSNVHRRLSQQQQQQPNQTQKTENAILDEQNNEKDKLPENKSSDSNNNNNTVSWSELTAIFRLLYLCPNEVLLQPIATQAVRKAMRLLSPSTSTATSKIEDVETINEKSNQNESNVPPLELVNLVVRDLAKFWDPVLTLSILSSWAQAVHDSFEKLSLEATAKFEYNNNKMRNSPTSSEIPTEKSRNEILQQVMQESQELRSLLTVTPLVVDSSVMEPLFTPIEVYTTVCRFLKNGKALDEYIVKSRTNKNVQALQTLKEKLHDNRSLAYNLLSRRDLALSPVTKSLTSSSSSSSSSQSEVDDSFIISQVRLMTYGFVVIRNFKTYEQHTVSILEKKKRKLEELIAKQKDTLATNPSKPEEENEENSVKSDGNNNNNNNIQQRDEEEERQVLGDILPSDESKASTTSSSAQDVDDQLLQNNIISSTPTNSDGPSHLQHHHHHHQRNNKRKDENRNEDFIDKSFVEKARQQVEISLKHTDDIHQICERNAKELVREVVDVEFPNYLQKMTDELSSCMSKSGEMNGIEGDLKNQLIAKNVSTLLTLISFVSNEAVRQSTVGNEKVEIFNKTCWKALIDQLEALLLSQGEQNIPVILKGTNFPYAALIEKLHEIIRRDFQTISALRKRKQEADAAVAAAAIDDMDASNDNNNDELDNNGSNNSSAKQPDHSSSSSVETIPGQTDNNIEAGEDSSATKEKENNEDDDDDDEGDCDETKIHTSQQTKETSANDVVSTSETPTLLETDQDQQRVLQIVSKLACKIQKERQEMLKLKQQQKQEQQQQQSKPQEQQQQPSTTESTSAVNNTESTPVSSLSSSTTTSTKQLFAPVSRSSLLQLTMILHMFQSFTPEKMSTNNLDNKEVMSVFISETMIKTAHSPKSLPSSLVELTELFTLFMTDFGGCSKRNTPEVLSKSVDHTVAHISNLVNAGAKNAQANQSTIKLNSGPYLSSLRYMIANLEKIAARHNLSNTQKNDGEIQRQQEFLFALPPVEILQRLNSFFSAVVPNLPQKFTSPATQQLMIRVAVLLEKLGTRSDVVAKQLLMLVAKRSKTISQQQNNHENNNINNLTDLRLIQTAATISTPNAHPLIAASFILLCKNIPELFEQVKTQDTNNNSNNNNNNNKMQDNKSSSASSSVVPELDSNTTTTSEALNVGMTSNETGEEGETMNNAENDEDDGEEVTEDIQITEQHKLSRNLPSPQLVARIYTIAHKCGASQIVEKLVETELFSRTTPPSDNNNNNNNSNKINNANDDDDDMRTEKNNLSNKVALQWAVRISLFCDAAAAPKELRDLARMKLASNEFFGEIYPALEMIQKVLPIMKASSSPPPPQATCENDVEDSLTILSTLWNLHGIKNLYRLGTLIVSSEEELKLARTQKQQKLELIVNNNNNNNNKHSQKMQQQQQQQQQQETNNNSNDEDNSISPDDDTKNEEAVLIETSQNLMNSFKATHNQIRKFSLLTKLFVNISVATLQETLRLQSSMIFDAPVFKQVQIAKLLNALISLDALERQNQIYLKRESIRLSKELNALRDELLDEEEKEVAAPPKGGDTETAAINGHNNNNSGDNSGNTNSNADDDATDMIANFISNELQSEMFTSSSTLLSESMISTIVSMFRSISHDNQGEVLLRCCAASLSPEEGQILDNNLSSSPSSSQQQQQLAVTLLLECGGETAGKIPLPAAIGLLNVEKNRNINNHNNNINLTSSSSSSSSKIERTVRERLETEIVPLDVMIPLLVRGSGGHSKEILDLVLDAHCKFVESDQQDEMQFEQVMKLLSATCSSKNNILSQRHFEWLVKLLKKLLSTDATTTSNTNNGNKQALTAEQREYNAIFGSGNETSENDNTKNDHQKGTTQQPASSSSLSTSSNALVTNMDATDRTAALLTLNNLSNRLPADDKEKLTCWLLGFHRGQVQSVSELVSFIQSQQRELSTGPVAAFIVTEAKRMCFTEKLAVSPSFGGETEGAAEAAKTTASAVRLNRELISALARADLLSQSFVEEICLARLVSEIENNKKKEKIATASTTTSSSDLLFLLRSAAERKLLDRSVLTSLVTLVQENPLEFDPHELIDFIELQLSTNFKSGSKVANEIFGPICDSIQQVFIAKGVRNFLPTETGKLLKTVSTIQRCLTASNNHSHNNFGKKGDQLLQQQETVFLQLRPEIQDHLHHHCSRIVHAVEPATLAGMLRVIISDPQLSQSKTFDLLAARVERICPVLSPEDWQPIASAFIHSNNNNSSTSSSKMETLIDLLCLQYLRFAESSSAASTNKRVIGQCHLTVLELLAKFSINDVELVRVATEAIRQMGLSSSSSSATSSASSGVVQQQLQQQSTNNMTFPTYDASRLVNLLESLSQVFVDEKHPADDIIFSAVAQIDHAKGAAPWVLVRSLKAACELGVPYHRSINSLFMRAHDNRQAILGSPELADIMRNVCYEYDKNVGVHISVAFTSRKRAQ